MSDENIDTKLVYRVFANLQIEHPELTYEQVLERYKQRLKRMPNAKAVAIAKDVLERLELERLNIFNSMAYIVPRTSGIKITGSLQEHIDLVETFCNVCALGGLFLSYIRLYNGVYVENKNLYWDKGQILKELRNVFSEDTLNKIECFFEGFDFEAPYAKAREKYLFQFTHEEGSVNLMKKICENIIENQGEFQPEKILWS